MTVKLLLAGDICLGEHFFNCGLGLFSKALRKELIDPMVGVRSAVDRADLFLFNLEGPVSLLGLQERNIYSRCFRGHPGVLQYLNLADKNVASIANNHILQHGVDVAYDTFKNLEQQGLDWVGQRDVDNGFLSLPYRQQVNGKQVVMLSWSLVDEQHVASTDVLYAGNFGRESLEQIRECADKADLLVVTIHSGVECQLEQNELSGLLREIAEAGADIVIAHHSHFFHRIERWYDSVIFYGLGNFSFDLLWHRRLTSSFLVQLEFDEIVQSVQLIPVSLQKMGLPSVSDSLYSFDWANFKSGQAMYSELLPSFADHIPMAVAKLSYFFWNLHKGESGLKFSFLRDKIKARINW